MKHISLLLLVVLSFSVITIIDAASAFGQSIILRVDGIDGSQMSANPPPDGSDWGAPAYRYLQDALAAAIDLDPDAVNPVEIWVRGCAPGTTGCSAIGLNYYPDEGDSLTSNDQSLSFELIEFVSILGGFDPGDTLATDRLPMTNKVILNGDLTQNDAANFTNYSDNAWHVVKGTGVDNTAIIDGVTIRGGSATLAASARRAS